MKFDKNLLLLLGHFESSVNKKKHLLRINYYLHLLQWKRAKLKLGRLSFNIEYSNLYGLFPRTVLTMKYLYQDETEDVSQLFQRWQKYFQWKWDLAHVISFFIALRIIYLLLKTSLYTFVFNPIQSFFVVDATYISLYKFLLQLMVGKTSSSCSEKYFYLHQWFVDWFIDFCTFFGIFF